MRTFESVLPTKSYKLQLFDIPVMNFRAGVSRSGMGASVPPLLKLLDAITDSLYHFDMDLIVIKQAQRELKSAPKDIIADVFALFDELMAGKKLVMPISKPFRL